MSKHVCFLLLDQCALWEAAYLAAGLTWYAFLKLGSCTAPLPGM